MKNWILLLGSLFFYSWGEPFFVMAVVAAIVADYFIARKMAASEGRRRKGLLAASLVLNVGLLLYFKYANFFVANLQALYSLVGAQPFSWVEVALPVGISFITFQKISYMVDVYRGTVEPQRKLQDLMLYILMFPQLIAGPIVRSKDIAGQLADRQADDTYERRVVGFSRFMFGLGKKVLIANQVALIADPIFAMPYQEMATSTAWIGILAYTFQIYFDFSGYSDMAIGLGKMLGFRFPENFNSHYTSLSISEFWRRWHITLGTFMKSYLYIPLGGNRKGTLRTYLNLVTVFLLSGLWHGASWNFVLWGAFHGFFLILDRIFMLKWLEKMGRLPAIILTFFVATSGWVLFRTETLSGALHFYQAMFSFRGGIPVQGEPQIFFLILAALISFAPATAIGQKMMDNLFSDHYSTKTLTLVLVLILLVILPLSIGSLASNNFNPFIYFRF